MSYWTELDKQYRCVVFFLFFLIFVSFFLVHLIFVSLNMFVLLLHT
ncbi:hypothetical protein MtrunA17_Chr7g0245681 [Medicago truncatula]|uniref:Transmembrane protein n=1 Tax=Medicago truncatula TaxID=3880 RepID=A0A396H068_MEDTR|nr:hypothetical protein MtrunA17_Chr7g0245681 [Medicago truncatula]